AEKSTFLEVAYLLIYGKLPNQQEFDNFNNKIKEHWLIHEDMKKIIDGFPSQAHPMGVLSSLATSLTAFFPKSLDPNRSWEKVNVTIHRLIAKIPTLVAMSFNKERGLPFNYPDNQLDYVSNFLKMMFAIPSEEYE